jgi:hypothetical protein
MGGKKFFIRCRQMRDAFAGGNLGPKALGFVASGLAQTNQPIRGITAVIFQRQAQTRST